MVVVRDIKHSLCGRIPDVRFRIRLRPPSRIAFSGDRKKNSMIPSNPTITRVVVRIFGGEPITISLTWRLLLIVEVSNSMLPDCEFDSPPLPLSRPD